MVAFVYELATDQIKLLCCHFPSVKRLRVTLRSTEIDPVGRLGTLCIFRRPKHDQELSHADTKHPRFT